MGVRSLGALSPWLSTPQHQLARSLFQFFSKLLASVSLLPFFSRHIHVCPNWLFLSNLLVYHWQDHLFKCNSDYVIHLLKPSFNHPLVNPTWLLNMVHLMLSQRSLDCTHFFFFLFIQHMTLSNHDPKMWTLRIWTFRHKNIWWSNLKSNSFSIVMIHETVVIALHQALFWIPCAVFHWFFQVVQLVKNLPANAGDTRDSSLILGCGRSPRGGNGNPHQYACLKKIQRTEKSCRLESMGPKRAGHDWTQIYPSIYWFGSRPVIINMGCLVEIPENII